MTPEVRGPQTTLQFPIAKTNLVDAWVSSRLEGVLHPAAESLELFQVYPALPLKVFQW